MAKFYLVTSNKNTLKEVLLNWQKIFAKNVLFLFSLWIKM